MYTRLLYTVCIVTLFGCVATSRYKVLERSSRKPDWLGAVESNNIITSGSGKTLEEAKNECLKNIREQIVSAVAIQVRSKTEIEVIQQQGRTSESFKFSLLSQSGNIPFLQGISLTKATGFYWERVYDTNDKTEKFGYHIRYPFSNAALNQLIEEYNTYNAKLEAEMNRIRLAGDTAARLETLLEGATRLASLKNEVSFEKRETCVRFEQELQEMLKNIRLVEFVNVPGTLQYTLALGKRSLRTQLLPKFTCNCGTQTEANLVGSQTRIAYNADLCAYTDNPGGELRYGVTPFEIRIPFVIDPNAGKVKWTIEGNIELAVTPNGIGVMASFQGFSKYKYPFTITQVQLKIRNQSIMSKPLQLEVGDRGLKQVRIFFDSDLRALGIQSRSEAFPYADVMVYYTHGGTKQASSMLVSNVPYTTKW